MNCRCLQNVFPYQNSVDWLCRSMRSMLYVFLHLSNWLYVLLNIERLVAVRFPLHARAYFNPKKNLIYITIAGLSYLPLTAIGYYLNGVRCIFIYYHFLFLFLTHKRVKYAQSLPHFNCKISLFRIIA